MPLASTGVLLKIYDDKGLLLIARPCKTQEEADTYYGKYAKEHPGVVRGVDAGMVPRI